MPFKKVGRDKYVSPSGRKWTGEQVKLYHATDGFKEKPRARANVRRIPRSTTKIPRGA